MRFRLPTALRAPVALSVIGAATLVAGCGPEPAPADGAAEKSAVASPATAPLLDADLPIDATAHTDRADFTECPYLDTQWVAQTNGQRVTGVGIDTRFVTPACQYWSYPAEPQLTVIVRHMRTPAQAMEVVDVAAPIDVTDAADQPAGWNGGRAGGGRVPGHPGAVYSVAKGPIAVSVWTNQHESVKAQAVAEEVIARLGL